jgi:hypothetical protein
MVANMKPLSRYLLAVLISLGCLIAIYEVVILPFMPDIPTAADARQGGSLYGYVVGQINFEGQSEIYPNSPPVYCNAIGRNSLRLNVYGVTNSAGQEQVLSAVRGWQTTNRNVTKLKVRFYERENWKHLTNDQNSVTSMHLPGILLREVVVAPSNE